MKKFIERLMTAENESPWFFLLGHMLFAAFVFSGFFLFNRIFVGGYDVLHANFPSYLLAKRRFLAGDWGLWNAFLSGGMPDILFAESPLYSPDLWILFPFPERYFFHALTFWLFIKLWLVGVFAFLIFREELENNKWAFFSSTAYQLSGFVIWGLTAHSFLSVILFFTLSIYLVWTLHARRAWASYWGLALSMTMTVLTGNIIHGFNALGVILVLSVYRLWGLGNGRRLPEHGLVIGACFATTAALLSFRWLSFAAELSGNAVMRPLANDFLEVSSFVLRFFVPEVFGVTHDSSSTFFMKLLGDPISIHNRSPHYFGILPALLVVWAMVARPKGRIGFWLLYVGLVLLGLVACLEPFDSLLRLMLYPAYHQYSLTLITLPIGFCALAGHAGLSLEQRPNESAIPKNILLFLAVSVLVVAYTAILWRTFGDFSIQVTRGFVSLLLASALGGAYACHRRPEHTHKIIFSAVTLVFVAATACLLPSDIRSELATNKTTLLFALLLGSSLLLLFATTLPLVLSKKEGASFRLPVLLTGLLLLFGLAAGFFAPWAQDLFHHLSSETGVLLLTCLGTAKFVIVALAFIFLLTQLTRSTMNPGRVYPYLFLILVFDLLPEFKIHSHIVMDPFAKAATAYPRPEPISLTNGMPLDVEQLDLKNFRVNLPNAMIGLPIQRRAYGRSEPLSSSASAYGVRSYGGYLNLFSKRFANLNRKLGGAPSQQGIVASKNNPRLLDLFGVGYEYAGFMRLVEVRPTALARFTVFSSFEVIAEEERALNRLADPGFSPLQSVVLEKDPGIPSIPGQATLPVKYLEHSSDELELRLRMAAPGVLLFNDSYHPAWRAYVNGEEKTLIPANYNFMAVSLAAGENLVRFQFDPPAFKLGLRISQVGILIFLGVGFVFHVRGRKTVAPGALPRQPENANSLGAGSVGGGLAFFLLVAVAQALFNMPATPGEMDRASILASSVSLDINNTQLGFGPEDLLKEDGLPWRAPFPEQSPQWLRFKFDKPRRVTQLAIQTETFSETFSAPDLNMAPKNFQLLGSMDGLNWNVLLEVRDNRYTTSAEWKRWTFANDKPYPYYQILVTANGGHPELSIARIQME